MLTTTSIWFLLFTGTLVSCLPNWSYVKVSDLDEEGDFEEIAAYEAPGCPEPPMVVPRPTPTPVVKKKK